jgi:hypothetical protein
MQAGEGERAFRDFSRRKTVCRLSRFGIHCTGFDGEWNVQTGFLHRSFVLFEQCDEPLKPRLTGSLFFGFQKETGELPLRGLRHLLKVHGGSGVAGNCVGKTLDFILRNHGSLPGDPGSVRFGRFDSLETR